MEGLCPTKRSTREVGVFGQLTDGGNGGRTATVTWPRSTRHFLSAPPEVALPPSPPTATGPTVRAVECGTSVQIVGGRLLGPEGTRGTSPGEQRSNVSVPVTDARWIRAGQAGV